MNFSYRYRAEDSAVELPAADYIARFRDAQRIAEYCRACPSYGSSWGCPPFGFSVEEYLSGYVTALVVATKIVPEQEGLPLSEAGRLMRPERKRIEARLLDMERRIGAVRSPMSAPVSIARKAVVPVPTGIRAVIPIGCVLRSKRADSTSAARHANFSASS